MEWRLESEHVIFPVCRVRHSRRLGVGVQLPADNLFYNLSLHRDKKGGGEGRVGIPSHPDIGVCIARGREGQGPCPEIIGQS